MIPELHIISGGQTGVDQGAMDFALENRIPCSGYCPNGWLSENGRIPSRYPVQELMSSNYEDRTLRNIQTSHGTLIIHRGKTLTGGTMLTKQIAFSQDKPLLIFHLEENPEFNKQILSTWLGDNQIKDLNIAGPRESQNPGIQHQTKKYLEILLT